MPNTLVHIGLHTLALGPLSKSCNLIPVVLISCLVPDIPWILRWAAIFLDLSFDPYSLLAYVTIQSSLLFSAVLVLSLSLMYRDIRFCAALSISGCALHILLDAFQIKWGNGVIFFAPFSWELWSIGLTWPDSALSVGATLASIPVLLFLVLRLPQDASAITLSPKTSRYICAACLAATCFVAPLSLLDIPFNNDSHYVATLRDEVGRPGKPIELDRKQVSFREGHWYIDTPVGSSLRVRSDEITSPGVYSVRGYFVDTDNVLPTEIHKHQFDRDFATISGLLFCAGWFLFALLYRLRN